LLHIQKITICNLCKVERSERNEKKMNDLLNLEFNVSMKKMFGICPIELIHFIISEKKNECDKERSERNEKK